jgi:K+-transporting ATPase ATPase C chain
MASLGLFGFHLMDLSLFNRILLLMIQQIRPTLILFIILVLLTGVLYPLGVTSIAQVIFPFEANGSMIDQNDRLVGSMLVGQDFTDPRYFQGRPSTTYGSPYVPFDPLTLTGSSGSNLGPLSRELMDIVQQRVQALQATNPGITSPIPIDLVTASASGLDPQISLAAAYYQVPRVARLRGMSEAEVTALVNQHAERRLWGFLGEPRVNVLLLNLALDEIK